jgi:hypothetical protein
LDFWSDLPLDVATGIKYLKETVKATKFFFTAAAAARPLMTFLSERRAKRPIGLPGREQTDSLRQRSRRPTAGRRHHPARRSPGHRRSNTLRSINPSVQRDDKPEQIVASLDPFQFEKWLSTRRARPTSRASSRSRYFRAQAVRMNRLVDAALAKLRAMAAGKYLYNDDDAFVIHKSEGGRLSEMDLTIQPGNSESLISF